MATSCFVEQPSEVDVDVCNPANRLSTPRHVASSDRAGGSVDYHRHHRATERDWRKLLAGANYWLLLHRIKKPGFVASMNPWALRGLLALSLCVSTF